MFHHYCQVIHVTDHLIVDFHALEVVCCYISFLEHQLLQPPIHHFSTPIWPTQQSSQWKVTETETVYMAGKKDLCMFFSILRYMWHDGPMIPSTRLFSKKNCGEIIALKQWHPVQSYKRTLPFIHPVWSKILIALGDCIELMGFNG